MARASTRCHTRRSSLWLLLLLLRGRRRGREDFVHEAKEALGVGARLHHCGLGAHGKMARDGGNGCKAWASLCIHAACGGLRTLSRSNARHAGGWGT